MSNPNHIQYSSETSSIAFTAAGFIMTEPDPFEFCWTCPNQLGTGSFRRIHIRSGFDLWITDCRFFQELLFSIYNHPAVMIFGFYLAGEYEIRIGRLTTPVEFSGEQQYVYYFNQSSGIGRAGTNTPLRHISIMINRDQLLSYFDNDVAFLPSGLQSILVGKPTDDFPLHRSITPAMHATLHQIVTCPLHGMTRKLFLESKALELIAHQLHSLADSTTVTTLSPVMHPQDRRRTELARTLLLHDLEKPPSLEALSRKAGMSHPKLNRCFRKLYHMTVFEYLRNERLQRAKEMLEGHGLSVTETAYAVGYDSISHFSHAYKKHFGISPGHIAKAG